MRDKLKILALVLGALGMTGTIAVTIMPMWKVTAFIGANLIVMEAEWLGLWMVCVRQADFYMQCKVYDSVLILPADIQAARGFMCASVVLSVVAFGMSIFGVKRTNCGRNKNVILIVSGCLFVIAALTVLIPVSWTTNTIVQDFYNPNVEQSLKREIGQSLYLGFVTFALLLSAGGIFLCRCKKDDNFEESFVPLERENMEMNLMERTSSSNTYRKSQYV